MASTTRRTLLSTMAVGTAATAAGVALPARADEHSQTERVLGAVEKRRLHREQLRNGSQDFSELSPLSHEGISRALSRLTEEGVINDDDRDVLGMISQHLFDVGIADVDTLLSRVVETITSTLGEAADTIAAVAQDSIEYASEALNDEDYSTIRIVIAHDIQGAIQGAGAGARVGALFGLAGLGAVIGGLGGGASGSVIGYFKDRR